MYNKLSKKEKKDIQIKYSKTKRGLKMLPIYRRLFVEGILLILCGIITFISLLIENTHWWYWFAGSLFLISGLIFFIAQIILKHKDYNAMLKNSSK